MKIHDSNSNDVFDRLRTTVMLFAVLALVAGTISFAVLFALAPSASAQKTSGTITGTVTDPSGAAMPGATVGVVNERTGAAREAATNEEGSFSFPELEAGTYRLTVNKGGFKKLALKSVELHVADVTTLNLKMEMGAATETVMVESSPIAVNTSTGDVSNIMIGEQVRELPMNGRNFVQLTTLVPGAAVGESFDNKNKGLFAGVDISFSGAPSVNNQWTVDGAGNNDIGSQRTILVYPSIDGIEEFKIQRNSYGPEFGGAGGAQINVVTKGGSNQYHGDFYYFGRNSALNAKNYFLQSGCTAPGDTSCNKQLLRRNDFGYTVGGPVKKDKVYFFWSEEWNRERRGRVHHHCVPTQAERNGDFSNPVCGPAPTDPATGAPFPGNIIPSGSLSPAGQAYLATIALPNLSTPNSKGENWVTQVRIPVDWREENIRGDWNITKKTTLMLKYTQDAWLNSLHADEAAGLWGDSDYPALSDSWNQPGKMSAAKITTTISNTAVNDFQFSWSGNRITVSRAGDDPTLNDKINAVMPRIFPYSDKFHGDKAAEPVFWGGAPAGLIGIISPWHNRQDLFVWKDDFSKVAGKHTFKAGFLYSRNAKDEEVGDEGGEFWGDAPTGSPAARYNGWGGPHTTGNYYADYLVRGMMFGYDENQRDQTALVRWRDYEFYGGDAFKISRRVTLNYGARWSIIRTPFLDDNKLAGFSPAAFNPNYVDPVTNKPRPDDPCNGMVLAKGATNACSAIGSSIVPPFFENRSLAHNNNHMIAPRVGIAWDVFGTGRFAIRSGVGQFFSRDRLLGISMRSNNPPFGVNTGALRTLDETNGPNGNCVTEGCISGAALGGVPHQGLDPSSKQANSWQWNLTTETALWKNSKLEVGWVANRGIHLQNAIDVNQFPLAVRLTAAQLSVTGNGTGQFHPYPFNPGGVPQITIWSHRGDSIYHSLQAMYSNKFKNNSMLQVAYTWSKNLGDTTFGYVGASTVFSDNTNPRINRGPVDFDRRHVLSATLIYNLPALTNSNSLVRHVAGGWESNTIVNYASGNALTIQGTASLGDPTGTGTNGSFTGRPLRVAGQPCHVSGDRAQWLNPKAFTWDGYKLGTFGNSSPGTCAGPPVDNVDFAIVKNWKMTERLKMQLRLEMFNVFNHPQFRFNGANLGWNALASKCQAGTTADPCMINGIAEVAGFDGGTYPVDASGGPCGPAPSTPATPATCVAIKGGMLNPNVNFGQQQFSSQSGNREIQYALKFIF